MDFQSALFLYLIIIFSAIIHEYSHGWMAYQLGDPTAKEAGRLTLNPLAHIDLFGTVILPIFLLLTTRIFIGWAKPVPFNPRNLKNPKRDIALVGVAGPGSNFLIAVLIGLGIRFLPSFFLSSQFNIPTSNDIFNPWVWIVVINIWLALFNLIPLPPLDGSKILMGLSPFSWQRSLVNLERMGFFSLLIALFLAMTFLPYLTSFIFRLIIGQSFLL